MEQRDVRGIGVLLTLALEAPLLAMKWVVIGRSFSLISISANLNPLIKNVNHQYRLQG